MVLFVTLPYWMSTAFDRIILVSIFSWIFLQARTQSESEKREFAMYHPNDFPFSYQSLFSPIELWHVTKKNSKTKEKLIDTASNITQNKQHTTPIKNWMGMKSVAASPLPFTSVAGRPRVQRLWALLPWLGVAKDLNIFDLDELRVLILYNGNISGVNYRNFNLGHQISSKGRGTERAIRSHLRGGAQRGGRSDLQKCDYPIQERV